MKRCQYIKIQRHPSRIKSWAKMRSPIHFVLLGLVCSVALGLGAESDFYRSFLSAVSTDDLQRLGVVVTSPTLADTNNTALKLAAFTNSFSVMRERGEMSEIRLGMSMSEVVAKWGKPPRLFANCGGGPHFSYSDASLVFHGNVLWEVYIPGRNNPDQSFLRPRVINFEAGLTASSKIQDCVRILGKPNKTTNWKNVLDYLVYEARDHVMILAFDADSGELSHMRLEKRGTGPLQIH